MYTAAEQWASKVTKIAEAKGKADPFFYLGFSGGFQKPLCSYGMENVNFMKRVAAKYDPDRVFQKLVPGGFKLEDAC